MSFPFLMRERELRRFNCSLKVTSLVSRGTSLISEALHAHTTFPGNKQKEKCCSSLLDDRLRTDGWTFCRKVYLR